MFRHVEKKGKYTSKKRKPQQKGKEREEVRKAVN